MGKKPPLQLRTRVSSEAHLEFLSPQHLPASGQRSLKTFTHTAISLREDSL